MAKVSADRRLRSAKDGPEVAPHKSRWDRSKCKRNKGGPHDMQLVREKPVILYDYRRRYVPGFEVCERRPFRGWDREWRCTHCNKKEQTYPWWDAARDYVDDWTEWRRQRRKNP